MCYHGCRKRGDADVDACAGAGGVPAAGQAARDRHEPRGRVFSKLLMPCLAITLPLIPRCSSFSCCSMLIASGAVQCLYLILMSTLPTPPQLIMIHLGTTAHLSCDSCSRLVESSMIPHTFERSKWERVFRLSKFHH